MELRQLRTIEAAEAAYVFLTQGPRSPALMAAAPGFWHQVETLKTLIDMVNNSAVQQAPETWQSRNAARTAAVLHLRDHTLRGLRQVAKVIVQSKAGTALSPGFPSLVPVPETSNVEVILQAAYSTAQELAPYQALFVARGIAPDFLTRLKAEIAQVEALADAARDARCTQLTATQEIARLLGEIRGILRCLTVELRRLCTADGARGAVTYETWLCMKRPRRQSRPAQKPAEPIVVPVSAPALVTMSAPIIKKAEWTTDVAAEVSTKAIAPPNISIVSQYRVAHSEREKALPHMIGQKFGTGALRDLMQFCACDVSDLAPRPRDLGLSGG